MSTANGNYVLSLKKGLREYELNNHLGNVLSVVSDRKLPRTKLPAPTVVHEYVGEVLGSSDYAAFGAPLDGRVFNGGNYRYGFNGKENDNEVKGNGNQQDYGMRIYDPRLGKFLSVDPLAEKFPHYTPYQFAGNKPIACIDLDGLEDVFYDKAFSSKFGQTTIMHVFTISGLKDELEKQFASGNNKYDLYVVTNFSPEVNNEVFRNANTGAFVAGFNVSGTTEAGSKIDDKVIQALKDRGIDVTKTIKSGKIPIVVQLSSQFGDKAAQERIAQDGDEELAFENVEVGASVLAHEVKNHAIDFVKGKDKDPFGRDSHRRYYGHDYSKSNDYNGSSPDYYDLKDLNSTASKYKRRIKTASIALQNNLNQMKEKKDEGK